MGRTTDLELERSLEQEPWDRELFLTGLHAVPGETSEPEAATLVTPLRAPPDPAAQVLRCAQEVHVALGPGLEDFLYARALALDLSRAGLCYLRDSFVEIRFRGSLVGRRRVAFLLDDLAVDLAAGPSESMERTRARARALLLHRSVGLSLHFGGACLQASRAEADPLG